MAHEMNCSRDLQAAAMAQFLCSALAFSIRLRRRVHARNRHHGTSNLPIRTFWEDFDHIDALHVFGNLGFGCAKDDRGKAGLEESGPRRDSACVSNVRHCSPASGLRQAQVWVTANIQRTHKSGKRVPQIPSSTTCSIGSFSKSPAR